METSLIVSEVRELADEKATNKEEIAKNESREVRPKHKDRIQLFPSHNSGARPGGSHSLNIFVALSDMILLILHLQLKHPFPSPEKVVFR